MHGDTLIPLYTIVIVSILLIGLIFKTIRIPYVVSYLVVGILLGPHAAGLVQHPDLLKQFEMVGLIFLLFFVGMEISLEELLRSWRVPVIGTILQVGITLGIVLLLGTFLDWSFIRVLLIAFVISISSTAVVIKLLNEWGLNNTRVGRNVIGVLLVQDIALIPMIILIDFMKGEELPVKDLILQLIGGTILVLMIIFLVRKKEIHLPFLNYFKGHRELQIFASLAICLVMVMASEFFRLSPFLGAFMAGIYVRATRETEWIHITLEPFYIFVFNTAINTGMMRMLGESWRDSLVGGAMLAQVGEFSFVILSVGSQSGIVTEYTYQIILALITLTLLLSPGWIGLFRRLTRTRAH
jgi:CPA2 family monovalent cation:H+ antiporter-2